MNTLSQQNFIPQPNDKLGRQVLSTQSAPGKQLKIKSSKQSDQRQQDKLSNFVQAKKEIMSNMTHEDKTDEVSPDAVGNKPKAIAS